MTRAAATSPVAVAARAARSRSCASAASDQPGLPRPGARRPGLRRRATRHTTFVDERPELSARAPRRPRAAPAAALAEVTVNQPERHRRRAAPDPAAKLPGRARGRPAGRLEQRLDSARPGGVRRCAARADARCRSPTPRSATRTSRCSPRGMRTFDLVRVAPHSRTRSPADAVAGVLGRGDLRRRAALPRTRTRGSGSRALRELMPNLCLQMLLRGRNLLGYERYPTRSCARSSRRRRRRGSTSSASSTR